MSVVRDGSYVRVGFRGALADGGVFDSVDVTEPRAFRVGAGTVLPAFEAALLGMSPGERRSFVLRPEEAYGARDPSRWRDLPRAALPLAATPQIGDILGVTTDSGLFAPVTVATVHDDRVEIDLNHPLAGRELHYVVDVIDVSDPGDDALAGARDGER